MIKFDLVKQIALLLLFSSTAVLAQDAPSESPAEVDEPPQADVSAGAEDGGETAGGQPGSEVIYIPFKPPFVVNYGGVGRLRYLKADVAVRLDNANAATSVRHHMPYLRNNLVMLFSAQTEESLSSQEGKEALRQEALREVREVLMAEDQQAGVVDLYFNSLIVQN